MRNAQQPFQTSHPYFLQDTSRRPLADLPMWRAQLKPATQAHRSLPLLEHVLSTLEKKPSELNSAMAQSALMFLLENDEYDAFVDVYAEFQNTQAAAHPADQGGYKRKLELCLPSNWVPEDPDKMLAAFERIQVDVLQVGRARENAGPAPDAASQVVAHLLQRGLTDLRIDAVLGHTQPVAQAFQNSALKTIEFGGGQLNAAAMGSDEMACFQRLLQGLAHCSSLERLVIGHRDLLKLHAEVAPWQNHADGPSLKAVELRSSGTVAHVDATDLTPMLQVLRDVPTLSSLRVEADVGSAAKMKAGILTPLEKSASLHRLEICAAEGYLANASCAFYVSDTVGLGAHCPALKHIALTSLEDPLPAFEGLNAFVMDGGDLDAKPAVADIAAAFARGVTVETITISGIVLIPGPARELAAQLRDNAWIQKADLSGCATDLVTDLAFVQAFETNESMKDLAVPQHNAQRCLVSSDRSVFGLQGGSTVGEQGHPRPFALWFPPGVTETAKAHALASLQDVEQSANAMAATIDSLRRRRQEPSTAKPTGAANRVVPDTPSSVQKG